MAKRITWRTGRSRGVSWGEIVIPDNLGHAIAVRATANEPKKALARSATIAEKLVNSAADNPALAALLPPGAGPALKVAAKVLRSKAVGKALGFARRLF